MLPLAGALPPDSPEALSTALKQGLAAQNMPAREVIAQGGWPGLDLLRIDMTGVQISRSQIPRRREMGGEGGFSAARFELVAAPGELESTPVYVSLLADDAAFQFAPNGDGGSLLLIRRAAHGEVRVEIARADLERLIHQAASEAARQHGVEIKSVKASIVSRGPRAASVRADVTAKMFIASTTVTLSGDIDLDDQLNARLANLQFAGDGMIANLAGGFIRPHLAKLEGQSFPLMSFALGEISLRDVQLDAGETLRLSAQFGS
jgi:hypothetical protein